MNDKTRPAFLSLVILQAINSAEELVFGFYEKFPPMSGLATVILFVPVLIYLSNCVRRVSPEGVNEQLI
jgi:hypothetical protein